jgi:hypothetical protein
MDPTIVVTLPGGTTSNVTPERIATGVFRGVYTPTGSGGRFIARASATGYGVVDFAAWVETTTAGTGMPDLAAVEEYLESIGGISANPEEIQNALDAEAAAQRKVCRIDAVYPADLAEALKRRVARNLSLRMLPRAEAETGKFVPTNDPEVRRLERPHRKWAIG